MFGVRNSSAPPKALREFLRQPTSVDSVMLPSRFAPASDWSAFQRGYRTDGASPMSETPGTWHPQWWAFASNYSSDPFFIDVREKSAGFPVRFAFIAAGSWQPIVVADSAAEFFEWLEELAALADRPSDAADLVARQLPPSEFRDEVVSGFLDSGD